MSLWTNQSGTFEPVNFTTGLSGTSNESTWNHNLGGEGNYLWNVQSCDSNGDCTGGNLSGTASTILGLTTLFLCFRNYECWCGFSCART